MAGYESDEWDMYAPDAGAGDDSEPPEFDPGIERRRRREFAPTGVRRSGSEAARDAEQRDFAQRANYGAVPLGLRHPGESGVGRSTNPGVQILERTRLIEPPRFYYEMVTRGVTVAVLAAIQDMEMTEGLRQQMNDKMIAQMHSDGIVTANPKITRATTYGLGISQPDVVAAMSYSLGEGMPTRELNVDDRARMRSGPPAYAGPGAPAPVEMHVIGRVILDQREFALAALHTRILRRLSSFRPPVGNLHLLQQYRSVQRPAMLTTDWHWFFDPTIVDITFREQIHQLCASDLILKTPVAGIYDNSTPRERMRRMMGIKLLEKQILASYDAVTVTGVRAIPDLDARLSPEERAKLAQLPVVAVRSRH